MGTSVSSGAADAVSFRRSRRRGVVPLAVAVGSLITIVAILVGVGRVTRGVREEIIGVVEPARNRLYDTQRLLAFEEAASRGSPATSPGELRPRMDAAMREMRELLYRLGPDAMEAYTEYRTLVERWHAQTAAGTEPGAREPYVRALAAADRLHDVLDRKTEARRRRVVRLERWEAALIAGAVVPALGALVVLARVGRRQEALVEEARRSAREARARRHELERVGAEKEQFIRGITHDLKNPLGAVDAYAQLLEAGIQGELPEGARAYVARIRRATHQTLGIIEDLLELARAESDGLRVQRRATDAAGLVAEVSEDYRAAMDAAGLALAVDLPPELPPLRTDQRRVREILGNLLSNALKYTTAGGRVAVHARARDGGPAGAAGAWLAVTVRDTGPGIAEEHQERIFEEFHRVPGHEAAGAGLGLPISRRMARLVGGEVTVESRVGEGSAFTLWLPVPEPRAPDPARTAAAAPDQGVLP